LGNLVDCDVIFCAHVTVFAPLLHADGDGVFSVRALLVFKNGDFEGCHLFAYLFYGLDAAAATIGIRANPPNIVNGKPNVRHPLNFLVFLVVVLCTRLTIPSFVNDTLMY
jgi:hypothetical protein